MRACATTCCSAAPCHASLEPPHPFSLQARKSLYNAGTFRRGTAMFWFLIHYNAAASVQLLALTLVYLVGR